MPVTEIIGSDSYGGVIVYISKSGKTFDFVTLASQSFGDHHMYTEDELILLRNSNANILRATKRANGGWKVSKSNLPISLGKAIYRRDPSF